MRVHKLKSGKTFDYGRLVRATADIIADYASGLSSVQIAKKYDCSATNIRAVLKKNGVPRRQNVVRVGAVAISEEEKQRMVDLYEAGKSTVEVARIVGRKQGTIYGILKERTKLRPFGDAFRKYTIDETVFDEVTDEGAYWIGMLMTDGCIRHLSEKSSTIYLTARSSEKYHLERFLAFVKSNKKPDERSQSIDSYTKGSGKISRAKINSFKIAKILETYGVSERKTMTAEIKILENNPHFWRGAVDGDGYVVVHERKNGTTSLCIGLSSGSSILCQQFADFVKLYAPHSAIKSNKNGTCYHARVHGHDAKIIANVMWTDGCISIDRKKEKIEIIKTMPLKNSKIYRRFSEMTKNDLQNLILEFRTWNRVARHLGVPKETIRRMRQDRGIPTDWLKTGQVVPRGHLF